MFDDLVAQHLKRLMVDQRDWTFCCKLYSKSQINNYSFLGMRAFSVIHYHAFYMINNYVLMFLSNFRWNLSQNATK